MLYIFLGLSMYFASKKKALIDKVFRKGDYRPIIRQKSKNKIDKWLNKNNIKLSKSTFFIILLIASGLIFSISISFGLDLIFCFLVLFLFIFTANFFIAFRRKRIAVSKTLQLEQFLTDLMGNLYANPNILTGMQGSIENISYPLREDIENIIEKVRSGSSFNEAVREHIDSSQDPIQERIFLGFIAANEKGFDLVKFIKDQLDYIRQQQSLKRYIEILSTGPKYTAYIIMAVPLLVIFVVCILNRAYMQMLFSSTGLIILVYSIVSYFIGFSIIKRLINSITRRRS